MSRYHASVRDETDELLDAWRRERPDLDVTPLAVLSRVTRLARHLDRERRAAFAEQGLEAYEFDVLTALRRAGPPYELTPGRLVRETLVGSGTTTNRLDRLAARGLVERRPDPEDGRARRIRLTDEGRDRADAAIADLLERERRLLRGLSERDRDTLAALLRGVLENFEGDLIDA
jgi:DNA-binding MarR family transcriptional regulator